MTTGQEMALAAPEADAEPNHRWWWSVRLFWRRSTERRRCRRALRNLSPRMLRDLGLHPDDLDWL